MSKNNGCANLVQRHDCTGIAREICTGPALKILRVDHYAGVSHLGYHQQASCRDLLLLIYYE